MWKTSQVRASVIRAINIDRNVHVNLSFALLFFPRDILAQIFHFNFFISFVCVYIFRYPIGPVFILLIVMAAALRMDSSTTLMTTTLHRPISSPKLAVTSQAMLLGRKHTSVNSKEVAVYPVPHCVLTSHMESLHEIDAAVLLESVSEETVAVMVEELELENLHVLPELEIEFDWRGGILVKMQ